MDSGTLAGTANSSLAGVIDWTGGTLGGTLTVATNGSLNISTANNHALPNCTLTNYGTVVWAGGTIDGGGNPGTYIYNYGLWDAQSDQTMTYSGLGGNGIQFNNNGTFRKSGGTNATGTLIAGGVFFNQPTGILDVQRGNFVLQGSGSFTGGYITTNATGTTSSVSVGDFNINGTLMGSNVVEDAGNLTGVNVINGALTWVAGNWNNTTVTIANHSVVTITGGGGNNVMANCTLTNYGTVVWASGTIDGGSNPGTFIYNYGLWDAQSDQTMTFNGLGGNGILFNNNGTFRKSGGTNATGTLIAGGVFFNQPTGILDVQRGNFVLQGSGSFTGGYITTNATGTTVLSVGDFNINGTMTGSNVVEDSGNLTGVNVINGALTWVAGNWNNTTVTITNNSMVTIDGGGGNNVMANCTLTNYGTVVWASGTIDGGSNPGTFIYNYGLWDAQSDQTT